MEHAALAVFQALEASGFGAAIRQATWVYPTANVGHVVAVIVFAGAVAIMDVRLLGAFADTPAGDVLRSARRFAVGAFLAIVATGFILFTAEASHLALNAVFQTKMILIALALTNVLAFELIFGRRLAIIPPRMPLPTAARVSAFLSLAIWIAVATAGRSIAYF